MLTLSEAKPVFPSPALMASVAPAAPADMPEVVMRDRPPVAISTAAEPPARFERVAPAEPQVVEVEGCVADSEAVEGEESAAVRIWSSVDAMRLAMRVPELEERVAQLMAEVEALTPPPPRPSLLARIGAAIGRVAFNADRQPLCI